MKFTSVFCSIFLAALVAASVSHAHRFQQEAERVVLEIHPVSKRKPTGFRLPFRKTAFEIQVTLTNHTDETMYFERPVRFSNLHFVVMDESGEDIQLSPEVVTSSIAADYFLRIPPGESYSATVNLLDVGRAAFRYRFKKGRLYNLYARYCSGYETEDFKRLVEDRNALLFQGHLESNITSFRW
jgi:hypothetical protein